MAASTQDLDVLIVGAGPVGLATALSLAAQAQMMKGDAAAADAIFARAAKLKPDDLRVRMAIALSNAAKGKGPAALAELRAVAAADKGTNADMALINLLVRTNDAAGALKAVDNTAAVLMEGMSAQVGGFVGLAGNIAAAVYGQMVVEAFMLSSESFALPMAGVDPALLSFL
jgi:tetratricopeptide (TPR) repeat protein